ncbi:leukemia inhibitory factor receptor [Pseudophryne corroboree]|uniref:leukemia inhibitory factor receptor n=1 Tax=Pseudophryne corroboree TaxID=495146 RepID=UPI00308142C9
MWNKPILISYLAVAYCVLNHVRSQTTDSATFFNNLKCITHDLDNMICRWDTPDSAGPDIIYDVYYRSVDTSGRFDTKANEIEVPFLMFGITDVKIRAKNVSGQPQKHLKMTAQDITYVPHTPEIVSWTDDYQSDVLSVQWTVDSSSFLNDEKVKWEINVLRGENLKLIKNETFTVSWNQSETVFKWNWTSDFPLKCTSHSVRIQCYVYVEYYDGIIEPSDWSDIKTVNGSSTNENSMFPEDQVVLVGSNMSLCCKLVDGSSVNSILFIFDHPPLVDLGSSGSSGIQLVGLNKSEPSGDNVFCASSADDYATGTVVFVGYPPDEPQDFYCEARHLRKINCTFKVGRATGLFGDKRGTKYTLHERFSGTNISCTANDADQQEFVCIYDVKNNQDIHDFLLIASNPLGTSDASLSMKVTERIYPLPIESLSFHDLSPTKVSISWVLSGQYTSVKLLCEIQIKGIHGGTETRNTTVNGMKDYRYYYEVDNLHPYQSYDFCVRCSSYDHFWKWSDCISEKRHTTLQAVPSKLDIWTEVLQSPEGRVIIVYWKHLPVKAAKGVITSYDVTWRPLSSDGEYQHSQLSADLNRTWINLTGSDSGDYEISVRAINSAGSSPPSRITTVQLPSDVEPERIVGEPTGINLTLSPGRNVTCGYVVKWMPSFHPRDSDLMWKRFSSNASNAFINSHYFQAGIRYNLSEYGCKDNRYQPLRMMIVYMQELTPKVAPNFTIQETTSNSILLKLVPIAEDELCGFLQGYLVYVAKNQNDSSMSKILELDRHPEKKIKNITDPSVRLLKIDDLQSGTSYELGLQAYTRGGEGPIQTFRVVTKDNALGLILAILIPIAVAVILGIVASTICYRKREWIKETFYPDIPNPENSKALQFQKNVTEGNKTVKTLEMNPCTPNNVEVVESFYTVPKILDTELNSPLSDGGSNPEDGSEAQGDNHIVVSYCQPTAHEDTSNPVLDESATPSQVVYIDIQSMYQPQASSEEELDNDFLEEAGYKPQMQLPVSTVNTDSAAADVSLAASSGYKPQGHPDTWAIDSPGSPTSLGSENASFGSPCSVNSRHFLIPPMDNKDSRKPTHVGWSISSLFQNKQDE